MFTHGSNHRYNSGIQSSSYSETHLLLYVHEQLAMTLHYIHIYIYIYIYTYTIYTYIHTYIHIYTWEHNVRLPKWMSCHKVIVVITGRTHYFHDYMYMYIYNTYIYIRKHKKTYIYIHKMEVYVNWIMYISESLSLSCISSAIPGVALRYFKINSKRLVVQT